MMEEGDKLICHQCHTELADGQVFCGNCGSKNLSLFKKELEEDVDYQENFRMLSIYSGVIVFALILNFILEDSLLSIVFTSIGFAIIDIIFAVHQPKVWAVVNRKIKLQPFLWIIPTFITSGFIVSYSVAHINYLLFDYSWNLSYTAYFSDSNFPLLYSLLFVAVFPAFFEELAFRGFIYNNFKRISGIKSAIWGSSFLFALVHFSIIGLIWIFPFGLILAYMRNRYSSIMYGVAAHFIHNGTVTFIDYYVGNWTM